MCDLEVTMGTSTFRVNLDGIVNVVSQSQQRITTHNTLWDTLTVKVGEEIDMVEI